MSRLGTIALTLGISFTVHAQDALAPFVPRNASREGTVLKGHLLGGRPDSWAGAPDCTRSPTARRSAMRKE
jgi:hypothetical protein